MKAVFRAGLMVLSCAAFSSPHESLAAQVRGSVDAPAPAAQRPALGYTRAQVASRAVKATPERTEVAVFLAAKESGVIAAPSEPYKVSIVGLDLIPKVAACVIDGKVSFTNEDRAPVTLLVDEQAASTVAPGQTFVYDCRPGSSSLRKLRIKEWPHIRGTLFVGEVGVVGQVNANGGFALAAPTGKYELQLIGDMGSVATKPVEIKAADVDVGKLSVTPVNGRTAEQPSIEPVAPVEPVKKDVPAPAKDKPKDPVPTKVSNPVKKDPALVPAKKPIIPVLQKPAEKAPADEAENLEFESE